MNQQLCTKGYTVSVLGCRKSIAVTRLSQSGTWMINVNIYLGIYTYKDQPLRVSNTFLGNLPYEGVPT